MKKRIVSMLLLVVILIGLVPAQAFAAENTAEIDNSAVGIEGDSSFGTLLGNTVNEHQQQQQSEEFIYSISNLQVEGQQALVEFSTDVPATVVVAIYSEDGFTMLGSGTAEVAADSTWTAVDIRIDEMPRYFTAGAFLLEPGTNNPLSAEFTTTRYTKVHMDIMAATVADFDPEQVLNLDADMSTNFAVFGEDTIQIRAGSGMSVQSLGYGSYVISNADERVLAMQPGDAFAYTYPDGTVLIVCAASVSVDGTTVTVVEQTDAELSDVFEFVKIEADSTDKAITHDTSEMAPGVTVIDPAEAQQIFDANAIGLFDGTDVNQEVSHKISYNLDELIDGIDGALSLAFKGKLEILVKWDYQFISLGFNVESGVSFTWEDGPKIPPVPLGKITIPLLTGVSIYFKPVFNMDLSCSLSLAAKITAKAGFSYDSDSGFKNTSSKPKFETELRLEGSVYLGFNIELGVDVLGGKAANTSVNIKIGGELTLGLDPAQVLMPLTEENWVHECEICFEGDIKVIAALSVKVKFLDWDKLSKEKTWAAFKWKLCDCYWSLDFAEFGFTKCPHIHHKVTLELLEADKTKNIQIKLYESKPHNTDGKEVESVYNMPRNILNELPEKVSIISTNSDGTAHFYLPSGDYKAVLEYGGCKFEKYFSVTDKGRSLRLIVVNSDNAVPFSISRTTLEMAQNEETQLDALLNGKKVNTAKECSWSSSDEAVVAVRGGKLTAKKEGTATITARYSKNGIAYSASCEVTVGGAVLDSGTCGENLKWMMSDTGTLTIHGEGAMENYTADNIAPWYSYRETITKLVIKSGVISIGNYAFINCTGLSGVTIPSNVTSIGIGAFVRCSSLTAIHVDEGNQNYSSTDGVLFSKTKTKLIGYPAGRGGSYTIPEGVKIIDSIAFLDCRSLSDVTIPGSVTDIGDYTFSGCSGLTDVYYDGTEEDWKKISIGSSNDELTSAAIHYKDAEPMEEIVASGTCGTNMTWTLGSAGTLTIEGTGEMKSYSNYPGAYAPWYSRRDSIKNVKIQAESISNFAFYECSSFTDLTLSKSVKKIGEEAFYGCSSMKSIHVEAENPNYSSHDGVLFDKERTKLILFPQGRGGSYIIPYGVTSIRGRAFQTCRGLSSVTIPSSLTSSGENPFGRCTQLTSIHVDEGNQIYSSLDGVWFDKGKTTVICAPGGYSGNYVIPGSVQSIGDYAFFNTGLSSVVIPSSVRSIDGRAFFGCSSLSSVVIGESVQSIGEKAFFGCRSLSSVTIPSSVTSIGYGAFYDCDSLTDVYYGGTAEEWRRIDIGDSNFALTDATIHYAEASTASLLPEDEEELLPSPEPTTEPTPTPVVPDPTPTPVVPDPTPTPVVPEPTPTPVVPDPTPTPVVPDPTPTPVIPEPTPVVSDPTPTPAPVAEPTPTPTPTPGPEAELTLLAAHQGTSGSKGGYQTARFSNLEPGEEYVLIVSLDPAALLQPANLLYIAQANAAADGTLSFSYIPRLTTPSAMVTLYGLPRDRSIQLGREYVTLPQGDSALLTAAVYPEEWEDRLTWSVENPEGETVITISDSGRVSAVGVGTAYAVATVQYKGYSLTARCRVDVTAEDTRTEIALTGIQLGTTKATTELFSRDYARLKLLLLLPQNISAMSTVQERPENEGLAIRSARFTDEAANAAFALVVDDDRSLLVVPREGSISQPNTVGGSYVSAVAVTVGDTEFVTDSTVKLTVKKTMPRLKAESVQFNSFYSGQGSPIVIKGATVTGLELDTGAKSPIPAWLALEGSVLRLQEDAPLKNSTAKVAVLAETEEWAVPVPVSVSVKNTYKAPKLKLSATAVTFSSDALMSSGVSMRLLPASKNETLKQHKVFDLTASHGFVVEGFDTELGSFVLRAPEGFEAGKISLNVQFRDTDVTVPMVLTVKKAVPTLKLKPAGLLLNPAVGDTAAAAVTISPADFTGTPVISVVSGAADELEYRYENGSVYVKTNDKTRYNTSYKLNVTVGDGKPAALTVKTVKEGLQPVVTLKAKGNIDLSLPDNSAEITAVFKNYGGASVWLAEGTVTEYKGKTELSSGLIGDYFSLEQKGSTMILRKAEGAELTAGNSYTLTATLRLPDENGQELTAAVNVAVKQTPVKLKLSRTSLTLNKQIGDSGLVNVSCTTKGYTLGQPLIQVMDKSGKSPAEGELTVGFSGSVLAVGVNENTRYGTDYKVLVSAEKGQKPVTLTVKIPAEGVTPGVTLKASGAIDVIRSGSSISLIPSYSNCTGGGNTEEILVYSGADNYANPIEGVFAAEGRSLRSISADSSVKYKVKLVSTYANGLRVESPMIPIAVKQGSAKLKLSGTPALYLQDNKSRAEFSPVSADLSLNGIARAGIKDAKNAELFSLYHYGDNQLALGFRDDSVTANHTKLKSASVPVNIWLEGNTTAKPNATITVKLTIVK